jgi:2-polyprenyl-3-methyl-5-hydroxy-6-metoxy-1,4-benzoquinol methylase
VTAAAMREPVRGDDAPGTAPAADGDRSCASRAHPRVLVGIANFGVKNRKYLDRLIAEYRAMPFHVDIHLFSEKEKDYPDDVHAHVGLPIPDPWSLPFAHRRFFADNVEHYDLFVYSEDDTLIEVRHIDAFMDASRALAADLVPGFIRYEVHEDGRRSYPDIHGAYRWIGDSVTRTGGYTHARLSNDHSACYLLTKSQLQSAIASGGYLVSPHSGRYDMLCSAGTDPYTQCGLSRVICISHLEDFEIHHLPDAYVKGNGMINKDCAVLDREGLLSQIEALQGIATGGLRKEQLFATEKALATQRWDKSYYEPHDDALLDLIPASASTVLSIGCGAGHNETRLQSMGKQVTAVPLDAVIGCMAQRSGIRVMAPDLDAALGRLDGKRFDAILLASVVQHLADPVDLLSRLSRLLEPAGVIVGSAPNLGPVRRWSARLFGKNPMGYRLPGTWRTSGLRLTSASSLARWLKRGGLRPLRTTPADGDARGTASPLRALIAPTIYFAAGRTSGE